MRMLLGSICGSRPFDVAIKETSKQKICAFMFSIMTDKQRLSLLFKLLSM